MKKNSLRTTIIALALFAALACSFLFMGQFAAHVCCHEDCPVCYQLDVCRETARGFSAAAILISAFAMILFVEQVIRKIRESEKFNTLTSLKIKLVI